MNNNYRVHFDDFTSLEPGAIVVVLRKRTLEIFIKLMNNEIFAFTSQLQLDSSVW